MNNTANDTLPWYKQFWPWFLILLPLSVVIAGLVTFYIAQKSPPSLVSGNYYKEGLAINTNMQLEANAKKLGLSAIISTNRTTFNLQLIGLAEQPSELLIDLSHATISQHDQSFSVTRVADGIYHSSSLIPQPGKWYISIRNPENTWEIKKVLYLNKQ